MTDRHESFANRVVEHLDEVARNPSFDVRLSAIATAPGLPSEALDSIGAWLQVDQSKVGIEDGRISTLLDLLSSASQRAPSEADRRVLQSVFFHVDAQLTPRQRQAFMGAFRGERTPGDPTERMDEKYLRPVRSAIAGLSKFARANNPASEVEALGTALRFGLPLHLESLIDLANERAERAELDLADALAWSVLRIDESSTATIPRGFAESFSENHLAIGRGTRRGSPRGAAGSSAGGQSGMQLLKAAILDGRQNFTLTDAQLRRIAQLATDEGLYDLKISVREWRVLRIVSEPSTSDVIRLTRDELADCSWLSLLTFRDAMGRIERWPDDRDAAWRASMESGGRAQDSALYVPIHGEFLGRSSIEPIRASIARWFACHRTT